MTFQPPTFKNIGKSVKDLFKKSYDFDHSLKVINKSTRAATIESGVVAPKKTGELRGYVKYSADTRYGLVDTELHTDANEESKATLRSSKLARGLALAVTAQSKDKKDKSFSKGGLAVVDAEYVGVNGVTFTDTFKTDGETHKMESSVAVGYEGITAAASAALDLTNGADVKETNVALEYRGGDYVTSLWTENNRDVLNAGYYLTVNRDHVVGAQLKYDLNAKDRTWTLGSQYRVDADTVVKAKAELSSSKPSSSTISTAVEHRLANPNLKFGVAAQFKSQGVKSIEATEIGLTLSLGDF